jgi:hypothetical protein
MLTTYRADREGDSLAPGSHVLYLGSHMSFLCLPAVGMSCLKLLCCNRGVYNLPVMSFDMQAIPKCVEQ